MVPGRMVLPKVLREQMHLKGAGRLQAEMVAGELRLVPEVQEVGLIEKDGVLVADFKGPPTDVRASIKADREAHLARVGGARRRPQAKSKPR